VAHAGQEIHGRDGFTLRLIRIEDEVLEMEASYGGSGAMPPEHLHPRQAERFEVLDGEIRAVIDGDERRYEQGDTFEVPPGTRHTMGATTPTRLRWEVRPALRTADFFERLNSGEVTDFAAFLDEYSEEFRLAAAPQ
jgi:quercetin dioxygenase-like cupin family protein